MKSSLLTLVVVSSLALTLSGCFKSGSHEGCSTCSDDTTTSAMQCTGETCIPALDDVVSEEALAEKNMPEVDEFEEMIVKEK